MPHYDHKCTKCGPILVETESFSAYEKYEEVYGLSEGGDIRVPCPGCGGWAPRDYSVGVAAAHIKGGHKYTTHSYRAGAEESWMKDEVNNVKEILRFREGKRPYVGYSIDPEVLGAKKVSMEVAKARAKKAQDTLGDTKARVDSNLDKR
jgi:hypothetical protein